MEPLPSEEAAWSSFQALGHRPEEFLRALAQLRSSACSGLAPDQLLPVIAATLRGSAADLELLKVEQIGGLATAIFDRVARSDGPARGIFLAEAAAAYGEAIGREVRVEEIQPVVNELLGANVLMQRIGQASRALDGARPARCGSRLPGPRFGSRFTQRCDAPHLGCC